MPPAPPPPPANLPNFSVNITNSTPAALPNTSALLKSIEKGTKLKKTVTNDRSAPLISTQRNSVAPNRLSQASVEIPLKNTAADSASLGGLFANGFPTLRSTKQTSEKANQPLAVPISASMQNKLKKEAVKTLDSTKPISINIEKTLNSGERNTKLAAASEGNKKMGKSHSPLEISSSSKPAGKKIEIPSSKISISEENQERWQFTNEIEENLPNPRKYTACKKKYLSEIMQSSGNYSDTATEKVTEGDIKGFIKTLKYKIDKAVIKEDYEECVRLKTKLKSFESIEKRIKSGERISVTELPI